MEPQSPVLRTLVERGFVNQATDTATRLLDAAGPSVERMRTALHECDRITALAADHPQAADAAEHLRTHLASLVDLHDRAAALGDDTDRPMLVERLVRGVEALASAAAVARRALARSALRRVGIAVGGSPVPEAEALADDVGMRHLIDSDPLLVAERVTEHLDELAHEP